MKLLPYDAFNLETTASLDVVRDRLQSQVESPKTFRFGFSRHHLPYEGRVSERGFSISRIIHYRNSFLPVIEGRFVAIPTGTQIQITMSLHPLVTVFLSVWFLAWYGGVIPAILIGVMPPQAAILFAGMPILFLGIAFFAFWHEAGRSRRDLTAIFLGSVRV